MPGAVAALLDDGRRLHLQHGPIDLLISAEGAREESFHAAMRRFDGLLEELVAELDLLRRPVKPGDPPARGAVARRMQAACQPYAAGFITPMAAVAGAVADEIAQAILAAAQPARLVINNGGDIAFHAAPGQRLKALISGPSGRTYGQVSLPAGPCAGGMATSGQGGRSFSFGIADGVTVLAGNAAAADAAATVIANAVNLPDHPAIRRAPASSLAPDSDLGDRLVVISVGTLRAAERGEALDRGAAEAGALLRAGLIDAAALFLGDDLRLSGRWGLPGQPAITQLLEPDVEDRGVSPPIAG